MLLALKKKGACSSLCVRDARWQHWSKGGWLNPRVDFTFVSCSEAPRSLVFRKKEVGRLRDQQIAKDPDVHVSGNAVGHS